ncbi:MAG TPA: ATP-binding protein [Candidatus Polarisedimenticolia bacterium]|nr:ATP-binding protein [Candidatus Polarisedimenticolia bacterium]
MRQAPPRDTGGPQTEPWFWVTLTLSSMTIVAVVWAVWELIEAHFFRNLDYRTMHYLYVTRGMASSLLLAFWAAWYVLRQRRASEQQLHQSREHYRSLLEASPGAVALYDSALVVIEWNAAAERLYGYTKSEALQRRLATVPAEKAEELHACMDQVRQGNGIVEIETLRQHKDGSNLDVQLSLLPFHALSGQSYFLEVTDDIRERVRLRQALLQFEKLTTMGEMAAGTAHHLNTPLAAMLLRVQMMRENADGSSPKELEQLEASIKFCQQFVRRLLDFSRRPQSVKQPEPLESTVESVINFLSPQLLAKRARLTLSLAKANGDKVLADRNQVEALFIILLSNALDAVANDGNITISSRRAGSERIEVAIRDDGCGIDPQDMARIFQPFFSTKPPGKGTGLGLALASSIVEEHGGSMHLESAPGAGTTVYVELPIWRGTPANNGEHA